MTVTNQGAPRAIDLDRASAVAVFEQRYTSGFRFAPILAVIPAFNEEDSIGHVLEAVPPEIEGQAVDILVVDDGSSDGTVAVVEKHPRVLLAQLRHNRGQGTAFQVGYQLARMYGATYIVTLDADLQWAPWEMPGVMAPLLGDQADLVLGSRVLGTALTTDAVRHLGVRFYAWLVTVLTGVTVTDTSTGYRAFRSDVTQQIRQIQPQYQSAELLIGAIYRGCRVVERPVTMHQRLAGESKKGGNLWYGARYGWVILCTWWREAIAHHDEALHRYRPLARWRSRATQMLAPGKALLYPVGLGLIGLMAYRSSRTIDFSSLSAWPVVAAYLFALAWWLGLGLGWAALVDDRRAVGPWCRSQVARYLPGGVWALATRAATVRGTLRDKVTAVTAENFTVLSVSMTTGAALASIYDARWLAAAILSPFPILAFIRLERRTLIPRHRLLGAGACYGVGYIAYGLVGLLIQLGVSGQGNLEHPLYVAGAACIAWAIGLIVVVVPSGVGVREAVYVWLLSGMLPLPELVAAAVATRLVTMLAELTVFIVLGKPHFASALSS